MTLRSLPASGVLLVLLPMFGCGGRSSLDFVSDDAYGFDATDVRDSASSDAGDTSAVDDASPSTDAGVADVVAAVPELAACLPSSSEMHVVATDDAGATSAYDLSGAVATRARLTSGSLAELDFGLDWWVDLASDWLKASGLIPGRYECVTTRQFPFVQLKFAGLACTERPTGSFTIVDIGPNEGDQVTLTRLLFWFDLTCAGRGRLQGCVRYGE
ncbi:MAG: hypothetical protein ABIP89_01115 [Polyangiaceae bacterium]